MTESVSLVLDGDQALVLFEMLSRWSEADDNLAQGIDHPAEDQVLWNMLAALESQLVAPVQSDYCDQVASARERLAPSRG